MKNITFFSLIYLALIGFSLVIFTPDLLQLEYDFHLQFLSWEFSYKLNYALLLCAPLLLYVLIFLLGFYIYAASKNIALCRIKKDAKYFEDYAANLVLGRKITNDFRSSVFRDLEPLFRQLANDQASASGGHLSEAIAARSTIKSGETSEIKLAKNSELFIKNEANKCAFSIEAAKSALKNKTQIDDEISASAYANLLKNGDYKDIKALKIPKNQAVAIGILERLKAATIELSNAEIEVLLSSSNLDASGYLQAAKILRQLLDASVLHALFGKLKDSDEAAFRAYLYILCALGLSEEFLQALHASEADYEDFKLVLFLKEHAQKYELDALIR